MDPALPNRLMLEIAICQEKMIVCEELAQHSENMEASAERSGHQYQLDREQADLERQVAEDDQYASAAIIPMLEGITPAQDVREELLEALLQGGGAVMGGQFTAVGHLPLLLLLQNNPMVQDWGSNLNGRITRKEEHLEYFRQMWGESLLDILRLREEVATLSRNRVSIGFL